jgi:SPFH domain / Band 7 family
MAQEDNRSFAQKWNEFWGRQSAMDPIPFPDTSILTQPIPINVGFFGYYLRLPPNTAAIVRSATDQAFVFTEGGHKDLQEGAYTLQYVDMSERFFTFSKVSAPALDSSEIFLTVSIFYKITDPTLIVNNPSPLTALFAICEGAIKNFIITHRYDELIGERENENFIADHQIVQHIREEIAQKHAGRAFWLKDVIIKERYGNPEFANLRHQRLVQKDQKLIEREGVIQDQGIAAEEKLLARTKAETDNLVKEIQAKSKARQSQILKQARILDAKLEALFKQPDMQQERTLKIIEAKRQALENLLQLSKIAGFPRDANDVRLMEKIVGSLSETPNDIPELPPRQLKPRNELSSTIINLVKKREEEDQSE